MLWLGNGPGEGGGCLYNTHYDINDEALLIGASFLARPAQRFLEQRDKLAVGAVHRGRAGMAAGETFHRDAGDRQGLAQPFAILALVHPWCFQATGSNRVCRIVPPKWEVRPLSTTSRLPAP